MRSLGRSRRVLSAPRCASRRLASATLAAPAAFVALIALVVLAASSTSLSLADPAVIGEWAGPYSWPLVTVHTALLPTGKVLVWDDHTTSPGVQIYNPANGSLTSKPYNASNLFCSGQTALADGRVIVIGGHFSTYAGITDSTFFNPVTESWSAGPDMTYARWYPTGTALSDGRVLATSGASDCPTCNNPGGTHAGIATIPEIFDPVANSWSQLASASLSVPLYPHMFLLPDGRIFLSGSQEEPVVSRTLNLATQTWTVVDNNARDGGSSVMYLPGKILKAGLGRNPDYPVANSIATAWVIDMTQPSPSWRSVAPMSFARTQLTLLTLPDGNVLCTGGGGSSDVYDTGSAVHEAEMWNPSTETWSTLAAMTEPRLYHSTALLLPDARVLVSGGGRFGPDYPSAEIYSPPYLFKGPRPTITSAPSVIQHTNHFSVQTPDAASITKVSLLRTGSVTHAFDENARFVPLSFTHAGSGALDVVAPANGFIAPPGYYMLFLVDGNGVPSVAAMVRIPTPAEDGIPPSAPGGLNATTAAGRVDLTWTAATDNVAVTGYNIHRGTSPGVVPTVGNMVGQSAGTAFTDTGFANGTYYWVFTARDANNNVGPPSNEITRTVTADTTSPTVSMTSPAPGVVTGIVSLGASASDNIGVAAVQFLVDGANYGLEDTAAPFVVSWDSTSVVNGAHTVAARARDARGNSATSAPVPITVSNSTAVGLAASYAFDEGSGPTAKDSSTHTNTGTLNGPTWTASGKHNGGLAFTTTNAYVEMPNSTSLNISGTGLTLSMWVNITNSNTADYVLLSKPWMSGSQPYPYYQYGIEFDANGAKTLDFYFGDASGSLHGPYSMTPILGAWTHVAFTYDGVAVKGYLDGVLKISTSASGSLAARATTLHVGVDSIYTQGYKGSMDDLRIYGRALSQSEIQQDMNLGVPPPVVNIPPVPDGTFGTPMTAARANSTGTTITLSWNTGCGDVGYHGIYGLLSSVSTYSVLGGVCTLGSTGTGSWSGVPAGNLWFLIAGDNGAGVEGTWGVNSQGLDRKGGTPSGVCANTVRSNVGSCP